MKRSGWVWTFGVAVGTLFLWIVSRGKWSDPLIDSGREWIVPDALARGELLYRDIVYWFGPFTPYFQSVFFRAFGSGFGTLVLAGAVASAGVLAALYYALARVTGRAEAALWTAVAVPALVFMPHAGGLLLGMGYRMWHAAAFALLAVAVASRPRTGRAFGGALAAGALAGLAGLCRAEWGLATLAACLLAVAVRRRWRASTLAEGGVLAAAAFIVFGAVLGLFIAAAGWKAVVRDGHVLLTGLPEETLQVARAGLRGIGRGLAQLLYSAAMWSGAFLAVEMLALLRTDRSALRRRLPILAGVLAVLGLAAAAGGGSGPVLFSAAPLFSLVAVWLGLRRPGRPRSAALAAFGALGVMLSHRRLFHIGDAAYVGPPLLFALVSAAGLAHRLVSSHRRAPARRAVRRRVSGALALAVVAAFVVRLGHYAGREGVPVPGTKRMLTARPELARDVTALAAAIRRQTLPGQGLAVFPEGELLNFLSERRNPVRYKLYLPGYVSAENEREILGELQRQPPAAVVLWNRALGEYGRGYFGRDYGTELLRWIEDNYDVRPFHAPGSSRARNPPFRYGLRRRTSSGLRGASPRLRGVSCEQNSQRHVLEAFAIGPPCRIPPLLGARP